MALFDDEPIAAPATGAATPLAERMRPRTLDEFVGQEALIASGRPLRQAIDHDRLQSIILWGPPGTGKTTLARLIASATRAHFISFARKACERICAFAAIGTSFWLAVEKPPGPP